MAGVLDGIRIVDLSLMIAGPYATLLLADLGADVIRIEDPTRAPLQRTSLGPPVRGADGKRTSFSAFFLNAARNKRSITLDVASKAGKEVLGDLVRHSDVVVENFSEHTRTKLGIHEQWGWSVKPDLLWASLTGYGRTGPESTRDGYDILAQARGGLMSISGEPDGMPMKAGNSVADYLGGLHLAVGILAALRHRERTGQGQLIDVSLLDSLVACMDGFALWYSIGGVLPPRSGNFHPAKLPAYSVFACKDGYIELAISGGAAWERFVEILGRPDLNLQPPPTQVAEREAFFHAAVAAVRAWTAVRTRAEVGAILDPQRIPNEPVRDLAEVWSDPQLAARDMYVEQEYRPLGRIKTFGSPLKLSQTPPTVRMPPPEIGEHTMEVMRDVLGYDEDRVADLAAQGVFFVYG